MRTLHWHLVRQVLAALLMTVAVFTFVLLLGNVLNEVFALLISRQASLFLILKAIGLLIPYVLIFALPMGMLAASLLVFGRFSADQELTAVRASGLSLISLITPILLLSLGLSIVCAYINLDIAPRCRVAYKQLLAESSLDQSANFLPEDRFVKDFPGYIIYVRKRIGNELKDIHFYQLETNAIVLRVTAPEGRLILNEENREISLHLSNAIYERPRPGAFKTAERKETESAPRDPPVPGFPEDEDAANGEPADSVTLREQVREENGVSWVGVFLGGYDSPPLSLKSLSEPHRKPKLSWMSFQQLRSEIRELKTQGVDVTPAVVQLHRQVAFSFASLAFTLIGIPLGIRAHRRETSVGIALALVLVLFYYGFVIFGQSLDTRPELRPHWILWFPNFLFQAVGGFLLWKANRGL